MWDHRHALGPFYAVAIAMQGKNNPPIEDFYAVSRPQEERVSPGMQKLFELLS